MLGLYYRIWVDCIVRAKQQPQNKKNWPQVTILIMSMCMSFNFLLIMFILEQYVFGKFFYNIIFNFLPQQIDYLLNFLILFYLPCLGLNYLLVFANKHYEHLLSKYRYHNGRLILIYLSISLLLPLVVVWVKFLL